MKLDELLEKYENIDTFYYDEKGNLLFSCTNEDGIPYLIDTNSILLELDSQSIDDWENKCIAILREKGIDCDLYPIDEFYDSFIYNFYSGNKRPIYMESEEQKEIYNQIKKYEHDIKNDPSNKNLILEALSICDYILGYISEDLKKDKEFAKKIVEITTMGIIFLDPKFQNDKEIALEAVQHDGLSLCSFSDEIKNDLDVVIMALKNNDKAYEFVGDKLKNSEDFILNAKNNSIDLDILEMEKNNRNAFWNDLSILYDNEYNDNNEFSEIYQPNMYGLDEKTYDILCKARYEENLDKKNEMLTSFNWDDESFVNSAICIDASFLEYASDRLKDDEDIVTAAIKNDKDAIKYASKRLQDSINRLEPTINSKKIVEFNKDLCLSINDGVFYKLNDDNSQIEIYNYNPDDSIDDRNNFSFYIKFIRSFPNGSVARNIDINMLLKKLHDDNEKELYEENGNRPIAFVGEYKNVLKVIKDTEDMKIGYTSFRTVIGDIPLINEQLIENFNGYILTNKGIYNMNCHYDWFYGMPEGLEKFMDDILLTVSFSNNNIHDNEKDDLDFKEEFDKTTKNIETQEIKENLDDETDLINEMV